MIRNLRISLYWRLLTLADWVFELHLKDRSRKSMRPLTALANSIDRAALWVAPPGYMNEPAKAWTGRVEQ
jgi:hypothetical protein